MSPRYQNYLSLAALAAAVVIAALPVKAQSMTPSPRATHELEYAIRDR